MARPIVFLSSSRDPGDEAAVNAALGTPGARLIACDPDAFLESAKACPTLETAVHSLPAEDLRALDASEFARLGDLLHKGPVEPLSGQRLGNLMARSILYRAVPFAKSLRLAQSVMPGADRLVLVGDSSTPPGLDFPGEFHDLYAILERLAHRDGISCERVARPQASMDPVPSAWSPTPMLVRIESTLNRVRARRVLAVELYQGVRRILARQMRGVSILPFAAPPSSAADREAARALSEEFGRSVLGPSDSDTDTSIATLRAQAIEGAVSEDLPRSLARGRALQAILRRFRPQVVLLMEDVSPSGRLLGSIARRAGAWTVVIQHGLTGEDIGGTHVMPGVANVHCAWGSYSADWNVAHGAPSSSQVVIGDPMLDSYFATPRDPTPETVPRAVVYASQPYVGVSLLESDFHRMETLRALLPFEQQGISVVVKPHPKDSVPTLRRMVVAAGFSAVIWDTSLEESLRRPAVVVTKTSTVALEAMLRARPVVLAAFAGRGDRTGLSKHGAALVATSPSELTEAVQSCLTRLEVRERLARGRAQLLGEYLDGMDGHATARLAEHIHSHLPPRRH